MKVRLAIILACFLTSTASGAAPPSVAVDVGHTLADPGASSARGRSEFAFNLDFAKVLAAALRAEKIKVQEVNFDGAIGGLAERPAQADTERMERLFAAYADIRRGIAPAWDILAAR